MRRWFVVPSTAQRAAARRNIRSAQKTARRKRTIAHLPASVRKDLGRQAAAARRRGGKAGHALEDRTREQIYEVAKRKDIRGRSRMGKWELVEAIRKGDGRRAPRGAQRDRKAS
jgi:hypothetical protein